jgi:hypothetical protein
MNSLKLLIPSLLFAAIGILHSSAAAVADLAWPEISREARPGAYWWWMGSAVDPANLTRELERYSDAGMGAVHIIPIYRARGWEDRSIEYLSPRWMEMLKHTVSEAARVNMNVDMTTGTGWCFGGPNVSNQEANASAVVKTIEVSAGARLEEKFDPAATQALVAFSPGGKAVELTPEIKSDGSVDWQAEGGPWRVYAISQRPSGVRVKRAAPGGEGHMLNLLYPDGVRNFLRRFDEAFGGYAGPRPRAMYHDSYEYRSDWAPDFLAQFEKRRGYRLERELPALFGKEESERAARVKSDYRETISDILVEESLPLWVNWSRRHGFLTRNEAHGSPGNLLDLYAVADIPETEMFNRDRSKLVSKLASSAAHVSGKNLVAAETATWLKEHFTETLADLKYLLDDMFVSGVNHIFYHGTCYSPDEAEWPGWLFYASTQMNPRNSIWRDVPALNAYAARCQSILQHGRPDSDILLYWPIHDRWHDPRGMVQPYTVHNRDWFERQSIGRAAASLWDRGFTFDYISDRQIASANARDSRVHLPGGAYRVVVVPACERMPLATMKQLFALAREGATVIFEKQFPQDVPGLAELEVRRAGLKTLLEAARFPDHESRVKHTSFGKGRLYVGDLELALGLAGVARESLVDHPGLVFIRRAFEGGRHYFLSNRGEQAVSGWVPLATAARSVGLLDPLTGSAGLAATEPGERAQTKVLLQLAPGESVILRTFDDRVPAASKWDYRMPSGRPMEIKGRWQVKFTQGGPVLPDAFQTDKLASWTELGDQEAQRFAGSALYSITFDAPPGSGTHWLDLGQVRESARVRLNGKDLGTRFIPPFRFPIDELKATGNTLEIEVTNLAANRIRDLDRRKVVWRKFHDINLVNIDYKPFDASAWPLMESGLIGPVTLLPAL